MAKPAARPTASRTRPAPRKPARAEAEAPANSGIQIPQIAGDLSDLSELYGPDADADRALIASTLREIMRDAASPAAARAQAARTLAEMVGALGRHAAPPASEVKPVAEMTRAELEAELSRSNVQRA